MTDTRHERYTTDFKHVRDSRDSASGAIIAFPGDLNRIAEAMRVRRDEREETSRMLRLDTGDDKEHKANHTNERDTACRFCRLEVYTEEQKKAQAKRDTEKRRKADFLSSLIDFLEDE